MRTARVSAPRYSSLRSRIHDSRSAAVWNVLLCHVLPTNHLVLNVSPPDFNLYSLVLNLLMRPEHIKQTSILSSKRQKATKATPPPIQIRPLQPTKNPLFSRKKREKEMVEAEGLEPTTR